MPVTLIFQVTSIMVVVENADALVKPGVQLLTVLGAQARRKEVEARRRFDD